MRPLLALLTVAGLAACAEPSTVVSPNTDAATTLSGGSNPSPVGVGPAGQLAGIGNLLQVQDARLMALTAGLRQLPPNPCRSLCETLTDIRTAAGNLADRVEELERLMETSLPPSPIKPPNPNLPPSPCQAANHAVPPNPCYAGQLGSINNVLDGADRRLAALQAGFAPPPDAELPAVQDALAVIWTAAMRLARTADEMLELLGG